MTRGRKIGTEPDKHKDRFSKYYYKHRARLSEERKILYAARKAAGACVHCGMMVTKGVLCDKHRAKKRLPGL